MISVIIPTYNSGVFIGEAIQSVLRQTCTDYDIIVIDDGSTDNTRGIIENNFPQVRYFYIQNQGAASARNYGIRRARGEFIAFLDADDLWLPEKLDAGIYRTSGFRHHWFQESIIF
jgi:glycosyltransferase involved in cell wall biosynthesis